MEKPRQPDGTPQDWVRYYAEMSIWEYATRYASYKQISKEKPRG